MWVNLNLTRSYYKNQNFDICDCIYCKFFIKNFKNQYNTISHILSMTGIDVSKPFEVNLPFLNKRGDLEYGSIQYIVYGDCEEDFIIIIDSIKISKAKFYPSTNIREKHFVIEISPIIFKNPLPAEIKKELEII